MIKTFCILISTLMICSCGQTNSKIIKRESIEKFAATVDSTEINQIAEKLTELESVEMENNESIVASGEDINRAYVFLNDGDSAINLTANIRQYHRIFGYAKPDKRSERLILLSVFTNDVENNPFGCKLGAYYDMGGMNDLTLKYISSTDSFVKAKALDKTNNSTTIYFEKKWIELK